LEIAAQTTDETGDSAEILPGQITALLQPFEDIRLLEVSTPQVNDVVRLEDDYGRIRYSITESVRRLSGVEISKISP